VRRSTLLAASAALSLLVTVGCTSTTTTDTSGPAATNAPGTTSTTVATVPKDKIIEEGDKICKEADERSGSPKSKSPEDIEAFMKEGAEKARGDVKKIRALGTPDKDADKFDEALTKYSAFLDTIEEKAADIGEDPGIMKTDKDLLDAQKAAQEAAKDFGFKVCGVSSDSDDSDDSTTTTTSKSKSTATTSAGASTEVEAAKAYLAKLSPNADHSDAEIKCIADDVFGDPAISAIATDANASIEDRKQLFSVMVDCIGPTFLIDLFMSGVETKVTPAQAACVRTELEGLSKTNGIAVVTGDPEAGAAFAAQIKSACGV